MADRTVRRVVVLLGLGAFFAACQAEPSVIATPTSAEELLVERAAATPTSVPVFATPTPEPTPTATPEPAATPMPADETEADVDESTDFSADDVSCQAVDVDSFGDIQLLVETIGIAERANLRIDYDLELDGVAFIESSSFLYGVDAAEVVRQDVDSFEDLPEGVESVDTIGCSITSVDWSIPEEVFEHDSACGVEVDESRSVRVRIETDLAIGPSPGRSVSLRYALSSGDDMVRFAEGNRTVQGLTGPSMLDLEFDALVDLPEQYEAQLTTCEVTIVERDFFPEVVSPSDGSRCRIEGVDSFGDLQLEITTELDDEAADGASLVWSVRNLDNVIVASGRSFVSADDVVVDEPHTYEIDSFEKPPDGAPLAALTCLLIGTS